MHTIEVFQSKFDSINQIIEVADLNGYSNEFDSNIDKNLLFTPITDSSLIKIVLYYGGDKQAISGGSKIYNHFKLEGFKMIENTHPSILINSMKILTEDKMKELNIPHYVDIVLPVPENSLLIDKKGEKYFLEIRRYNGKRKLYVVSYRERWNSSFTFLLSKL